MNKTYSCYSTFCDYDLDHEINIAVEETRKFIKRLKAASGDEDDKKAILKAVASEMLDAI